MEDRGYRTYNNGTTQTNGGGYKGFAYNYPLQQPDSPTTPRYNRRRCCKCCCFGLLIFLILLCIGAALVYFLMKPKAPKYSIQEGTITLFNLSALNHLNTDIKFTLTANNPNKYVQFLFGNTSADLSYDDASIGQGSIGAFRQTHKSSLQLPLEVRGREIILRGSPATNLKKAIQKKSVLDLTLKAKTKMKVKIGSLKSWGQKVNLLCNIAMEAPTKPGKASIVSSSCKLKD